MSFNRKVLKTLLLQIQTRATVVQLEQNTVTTLRARSSRLFRMLRRHQKIHRTQQTFERKLQRHPTNVTITRSGRVIRLPLRYSDSDF